jgi:hypothetical protein
MERADLIRRLLAGRKVARRKPRPRTLRGRCWLWTGTRQSGDDYGKMWIDGRYVYTHRLSAHLWLGLPLDSPLMARHRCIGSPACFNPQHLCVGTRADNNRDIVLQGRHCNARLFDSDVRNLVGCVRSGKVTIGKWAHLNGVAYATAYRAYNGLTHREAAQAAHERWDKRTGTAANPLLNPPAVPQVNGRAGCGIDLTGDLILIDFEPVALEIALAEAASGDGIPF